MLKLKYSFDGNLAGICTRQQLAKSNSFIVVAVPLFKILLIHHSRSTNLQIFGWCGGFVVKLFWSRRRNWQTQLLPNKAISQHNSSLLTPDCGSKVLAGRDNCYKPAGPTRPPSHRDGHGQENWEGIKGKEGQGNKVDHSNADCTSPPEIGWASMFVYNNA